MMEAISSKEDLNSRGRGQIHSQSGMTLVELMVALLISSVVVFFLFSIQTRMSRAYQGQGTVSEISENLRGAKQQLLRSMRMAGYGMAEGQAGVAAAIDASGVWSGFTVLNNAYGDGNDSFRIVYGDATREEVVSNLEMNKVTFAGTAPAIQDGEPLLISVQTQSCIVASSGVVGNEVFFDGSLGSAFNTGANAHCGLTKLAFDSGEPAKIRALVRETYRIDPTTARAASGYIQMSPSGEQIANDWIDMGVGYTNIQVATRYFEDTDTADLDGDGDPTRDWYSSGNQDFISPVRPANAVMIQASLSLEGRSPFGTRGASASAMTPAFTVVANKDHNSIGDWGDDCPSAVHSPCGIDLAHTADASRPERYKGEYIYRHTSSFVDLRNMGIGR